MPSVDAFEQVMAGQGGIASSNGKGQIVIECSTLPIDVKARGEVQLAAQGKILLDCPVSGTQPGEPVTAKRVVDQLVGDDPGVVLAVSDAAERRFAEYPRVADAEPHGVRPV